MVARQLETRRIDDPNVLRIMRTVPRHAFMPPARRFYTCIDGALPIGVGHDGCYGWPEQGPFNAIIAAAATDHISLHLTHNGRMQISCTDIAGFTCLIFVTKDDEGRLFPGEGAVGSTYARGRTSVGIGN
jgi:protein-L-isoaspartate O-methyltransferase